MNRPPSTILPVTTALLEPDVEAVFTALSALRAEDLAAITAALEAEDDPTLRERLDRVLDRMTKIEEAIALLMDRDVEDKPLPNDPQGVPGSGSEAVTAAEVSSGEREKLAADDEAMPDGSFPIRNTVDLHNAIQSIGRAKDPAAAKRWIKRRARELNREDDLPDSWE